VAQVQVQPQGAIWCDARTEAKVHQQAAIQCGAIYSKHNRPAGNDSVWCRAVELTRVESGERGSHAQVESPARGRVWRRVTAVADFVSSKYFRF
jgi:hypothetical protein